MWQGNYENRKMSIAGLRIYINFIEDCGLNKDPLARPTWPLCGLSSLNNLVVFLAKSLRKIDGTKKSKGQIQHSDMKAVAW